MPLLEIYKDNEVSASAVESDSGVWTPQVMVTGMTVKMKVTVPNIDKTFPTREEAERPAFYSESSGLTRGRQRLDHAWQRRISRNDQPFEKLDTERAKALALILLLAVIIGSHG